MLGLPELGAFKQIVHGTKATPSQWINKLIFDKNTDLVSFCPNCKYVGVAAI